MNDKQEWNYFLDALHNVCKTPQDVQDILAELRRRDAIRTQRNSFRRTLAKLPLIEAVKRAVAEV